MSIEKHTFLGYYPDDGRLESPGDRIEGWHVAADNESSFNRPEKNYIESPRNIIKLYVQAELEHGHKCDEIKSLKLLNYEATPNTSW